MSNNKNQTFCSSSSSSSSGGGGGRGGGGRGGGSSGNNNKSNVGNNKNETFCSSSSASGGGGSSSSNNNKSNVGNNKNETFCSSSASGSGGGGGSSSSSSSSNNKGNVGFGCRKKTVEAKAKKGKKTVPEAEALTFTERAEIAYASHIQNLYLSMLLNKKKSEAIQKKSEAEICFSDIEAEIVKLDKEINTVKQRLKEVSCLQESEAKTEELENIFKEVEDDLNQLHRMLKKVNLDMKIANGPVPLTVLKVKGAERDEFLSKIQRLSKIRDEFSSIMKHYEDSHKNAARYVETSVSTAETLRGLIKECSSVLPSVVTSYIRAVNLNLCVKDKERDSQQQKTGFQLYPGD